MVFPRPISSARQAPSPKSPSTRATYPSVGRHGVRTSFPRYCVKTGGPTTTKVLLVCQHGDTAILSGETAWSACDAGSLFSLSIPSGSHSLSFSHSTMADIVRQGLLETPVLEFCALENLITERHFPTKSSAEERSSSFSSGQTKRIRA